MAASEPPGEILSVAKDLLLEGPAGVRTRNPEPQAKDRSKAKWQHITLRYNPLIVHEQGMRE